MKEKSRNEAEENLKKVVAESKKVTDFFHVRESKSILGSKSSSATALCSSKPGVCNLFAIDGRVTFTSGKYGRQ